MLKCNTCGYKFDSGYVVNSGTNSEPVMECKRCRNITANTVSLDKNIKSKFICKVKNCIRNVYAFGYCRVCHDELLGKPVTKREGGLLMAILISAFFVLIGGFGVIAAAILKFPFWAAMMFDGIIIIGLLILFHALRKVNNER